MNKILSCLAVGALLAVPAALHAKIIRNVEKTFAVQPGGQFKAVTSGGNITIMTADIAEVRITAREEIRASTEQEADELLKKLDLTLSQSGNDVTAEAKYSSGFHFSSTPVTVSFTVTLPTRFNVDLHTSGGDIAVASLTGSTRARTSGGSLRFDRIDGDLDAGTSGGDITLQEGTAKARLNTSGGDIHVVRAGGPVEAETSGGSIRLEAVAQLVRASTSGGDVHATFTEAPRQDTELGTSGGDVQVHLPKTAAFLLDASTSGGEVDAAGLTLTIEKGGAGRSRLVGAVNGGGPRVKLRSSGGDITVRAD
jgi:DUF4097 and DUF4098 domain-containing protein YvlB